MRPREKYVLRWSRHGHWCVDKRWKEATGYWRLEIIGTFDSKSHARLFMAAIAHGVKS